MPQLQTRLGKFYVAIAAFVVSQAILIFKSFPENDGFLASIFFTVLFALMFFLVRLGFNWARWVLVVFLTFFTAVFILAAFMDEEYEWLVAAAGYCAAIVMIFQMGRSTSSTTTEAFSPEPSPLNTGSFTVNGVAYEYPQLVTRIKALFIDSMLILAIMVVTMVIMGDSVYRPTVMITLGALIFILYEPLLTVYSGTIGQRVMNIRVRNVEDPSKKIKITQAYGRVLAKSLLGWMSFVTINFNAKHRAIHDYVGGSVMLMTCGSLLCLQAVTPPNKGNTSSFAF